MNKRNVKKDMNGLVSNFLSYLLTRTTSIVRYNTRKMIVKQNVAEHSGNATIIAMVFSDYFNSIGVKNDTEKVLRMAITHDNDEVVSGDLPYTAKYLYGEKSDRLRKAVNELSEDTIEFLYGKLPSKGMRDSYVKMYHEYEARKAIESKIVKLADCADVIIYANAEIALGNKTAEAEKKEATATFNRLLDAIGKDL